jgi:hypothetical protein
MSLQQRRGQGKEQWRIALRPPAFYKIDLQPAGGGPQGQPQRRGRGILRGRQRAHQAEQRLAALRRQMQPAQ